MARKDFFERQDEARRQTALLIGGFILAVAGVIVAVNLAVWLVAILTFADNGPWTLREWVTSPAAGWTALITFGVIAGGSVVRVSQLARGGGGRVAMLMGGRIVDPETSDPAERRLVNVVEEIAIASGMPPPDLYILDHEQGINAFAAGMQPGNAVIGITRGALEQLDRDELQGVVAHEFSHIANGDMRINVHLLALLAGITLIGEMGGSVWRAMFMGAGRGGGMRSRRQGRGGGDARAAIAMLLLGLLLIIIGWIGVFIGRIIKAAVSRHREFLADAAAVQFTRNPRGIAGALMKIGNQRHGGKLAASHAEEISHMGFSRTVGGLSGLTATHPPLKERLRAIGPQFLVEYRQQERASKRERRRERDQRKPQGSEAQTSQGASSTGSLSPLTEHVPDPLDADTPGQVAALLSIAAIGALAGNPGANRLTAARSLLAEIPTPLYQALHQPEDARRLMWALLLHQPDYADQLPAAESGPTLALRERLENTWGDGSGGLQPHIRLPLLELAMPALRQLEQDDRRTLVESLDNLIRADGRLAIHEYTLRTLLLHYLFERDRPGIGPGGVKRHLDEARCVLSLLCHAMKTDDEARRDAWDKAMRELAGEQAAASEPPPREACSLREFSQALEKLSGLQPRSRKRFLAACLACVTSDGHISAQEAELLRTIAAVLDTPIPPPERGETTPEDPGTRAQDATETPGDETQDAPREP